MNGHRSYKRPPVTESAIELRFEKPFSQPDLTRAASKLRKDYPISEDELAQNVNVDQQAQTAAFSTTWQGIRLSSADRTDIAIFRASALLVGHFAPHKGWSHIFGNLENAWHALGRATGENIALVRAGVRYINRIDIPADTDQRPIFSDYIQFYPHTPANLLSFDLISEFYSQIVYSIPQDDLTARLAVASIASPLIAHNSILFDVDVFRDHAVPRKADDLWQLLRVLRNRKNIIFETCITDRSRELFDK